MIDDDLLKNELNESCGIIGVYAPGEDVGRATYFGLYALQHRGQESAGIAVTSGDGILVFKEMGLVAQVFNERSVNSLKGDLAVGHVRYSTTGSTYWENAQPLHVETPRGPLALVHNGNLINTEELRESLSSAGSTFTTTSDTEVIGELIARSQAGTTLEAIEETFPRLLGAYSVLILSEDALYAVRDPYGFRPLCMGRRGKGVYIASENPALDVVGAKLEREVQPGEILWVDSKGIHSRRLPIEAKPSLCIFEFIYFARPDTILYNRTLYDARVEMGRSLAREAPVEADVIIPVPDSGVPAAIGFAQESEIPFGEGLIKNRYIGRTFIQPSQSIRQLGVRLKLNPLASVIKGKKLVIVDDSIVRGNTSRQIVKTLREAGAVEVHMRISSPPVSYPCFYGIDTADRDQLIASRMSVEEIRKFLGVDSLYYLSFEGLINSTLRPREDFCLACFDGQYPIKVPNDLKLSKIRLEEKAKA